MRHGEGAAAEEDRHGRPASSPRARRVAASAASAPSVSPQRARPRDQLGVGPQAVDVQLALEVVELVLHGPRQEARADDADLAAMAVLGLDHGPLGARAIGEEAGDREAALEVASARRRGDEAGVHQLVERAPPPRSRRPAGDADLVCGEAHAGRVAHRVDHVVEQAVEVLVEASDGARRCRRRRASPRVTMGRTLIGAEYRRRPPARRLEQALGVDVHAPRRARVPTQRAPPGPSPRSDELEAPAAAPARHVGRRRARAPPCRSPPPRRARAALGRCRRAPPPPRSRSASADGQLDESPERRRPEERAALRARPARRPRHRRRPTARIAGWSGR